MRVLSRNLSKKSRAQKEQESYAEQKQHNYAQYENKTHVQIEHRNPYEKEVKNGQHNHVDQKPWEPGTCQVPKRKPIPAKVFHQVNLRDQGLCQEILPNGSKCNETKWVDLHHINHVQDGGLNTLDNLITLCKGHHQMAHQAV